jgi:hypothetical protein
VRPRDRDSRRGQGDCLTYGLGCPTYGRDCLTYARDCLTYAVRPQYRVPGHGQGEPDTLHPV